MSGRPISIYSTDKLYSVRLVNYKIQLEMDNLGKRYVSGSAYNK